MQKYSTIFITLSFLAGSFLSTPSYAADLEWSGVYRIEGNHISNSELNSKRRELAYGLHHLTLMPKIVAGDGITINAKFEIFNQPHNAPWGNGNQLGQTFGSGLRGNGDPVTVANSNTTSDHEKPESITVSELYLSYVQEYGNLVVGRVPTQFGLGVTHNAGRGLFDHWYDTRDLIAYKMLLGNMYFMPMFGKVAEGNLNRSDDIMDYMLHFQYENPETDLQLGLLYQIRKGSDQGSDAPTPVIGGTGATRNTGINSKLLSMFALRDTERFRAGLEASFQSGELGVMTSGGDKVTWGGFGLATEFAYHPPEKKWTMGLKAGIATGDDPGTDAKFEGFIFDRNYDVAMLLFNRPMGQSDFFRTQLIGGGGSADINSPDVEAISNVAYVAPSYKVKWSDRWSYHNTLITGWLGTDPISGSGTAKDLGYEWDMSVNFSPRKGVVWVNEIGLLFPGSAFKGGGTFDSKFMYGMTTKAAISF